MKKQVLTYEIVAVCLLMFLALILRNQGFKNGKRSSFDEALYAYMAQEMTYDIHHYNAINYSLQYKRQLPDYLFKKLFKHPPMYCYLIVLSYKIHNALGFGELQDSRQALGQAVKVSLFTGVLTIGIVYLLGRIIFGAYVGLLAALFLFLDPVHWICSQKVWMETTVTFFMALAPLLYLYSYRKKEGDFRFYILTGIVVGCATLTKYPGGLIFIALVFYTVLTRPKLFVSPVWMLMPVSMGLVLLHWLLWNLDVYGMDFIFASGKGFEDIRTGYKVLQKLIPILSLIFILAVGAYILLKKYGFDLFSVSIPSVLRNKYLWMGVVCCTVIIGIGKSWGEILPSLSLAYEPPTSWRMGFFKNEPWYFYLKKLFEYFPVYLFGYCAPFFISWKEREHKILPVICAFLIFLFFIFWRNYQSRYILPVVPWLTLLSAYGILFLHKNIFKVTNSTLRIILWAGLWGFVFFGVMKAIQVDVLLSWINKPCYF